MATKLRPPPTMIGMLSQVGLVGSNWGQWFFDLFAKTVELDALAELTYVSSTVTADSLDSGTITVIQTAVEATDQWKVREVFLSGDGTNYGAGGDKNLSIQDESTNRVYTTIPSATLKSLAAARWGDTGTPFPADVADMLGATSAGEDIVFNYSGGSTGYGFEGSLTVTLLLEKVA